MSRLKLGLGALAIVAIAGAGLGVALSRNDDTSSAPDPGRDSTEEVSVKRQSLIRREEVSGTVGHGTVLTLPTTTQGTVTWAPDKGTVLRSGDRVLAVDAKPVHLARGSVPLYRPLRIVESGERDDAGDQVKAMVGYDVGQLQQFLLGEGFNDKGRLSVDGTFAASTGRAVKAWQRANNLAATGTVDSTQLVFSPTDLVVETAPIVGQSFESLQVTDAAQIISAKANTDQASLFTEGAEVTVDPEGDARTGTVQSASKEVGEDGKTAVELKVILSGDPLPGDVTTVKVEGSTTVASEVLTVPVRALLALAEGGWAVEVVESDGTALKSVTLGEVVDTTAEISGIDEGTKVLVAT